MKTKQMRRLTSLLAALTMLAAILFTAACTPAATADGLTRTEAKDLVLTSLGVNESMAAYTVVTAETLNGAEYYAVEVELNGIRYRYRINTQNGDIEKMYVNDEPVTEAPVPVEPIKATDTYIGMARAKEIALSDAGVTEAALTAFAHEMEYTKGRYYYEIDFAVEGVTYEYDIDALDGSIFKKNVDHRTVKEPTAADADYIGLEAAIAAAYAHAGVEAAAVRLESAEWDKEKGVAVYEIDFEADGVEYDYTVNAETGAIIHQKKEGKRQQADAAAPSTPSEPSEPSVPPAGAATTLTAAEARAMALAHAGVGESEARLEECELEKEHGRLVYEIEFACNGYEYEYLIDAESGEILEADREKD